MGLGDHMVNIDMMGDATSFWDVLTYGNNGDTDSAADIAHYLVGYGISLFIAAVGNMDNANLMQGKAWHRPWRQLTSAGTSNNYLYGPLSIGALPPRPGRRRRPRGPKGVTDRSRRFSRRRRPQNFQL